MKPSFSFRTLFFLSLFLLHSSSLIFAQFNPDIFSGMKARSIGPAGMSGRIGDIQAVESNPNIIYVGAATGGVWKSTNGGLTWEPIFDDQPASSIGSIAIFQQNPGIVWVGAGEGNPRNSVGVGYGIFKSLDDGHTWQFLGLEKTEKIHRIVLHPTNPDIAYAAALGTTWGENPERGVFKTVNGGKTWKKILFVDEKTGCADLVMDPVNPNKLFAAMWEHRRWPWFFKSGGPGSGLYVTYDAGETWKKFTEKDGIPKGELGRIGIGIARSNPSVVYALIEAKKNALCRSEDGGRHWEIVNQTDNVNPRPFYYADIRVDPQNENRIYSLHSRLVVSNDGGRTFERNRSRVHSDHHALWIHPQNGNLMINGNDGGVAISYDRGETWRFVDNLPLAQYYHINVDMEIPYNIYGGMQDNGSWRGPSDVWENGGIRNYHWQEVGFGDGFGTLSIPDDPNSGYSMSQGGYLMRFNLSTGERKDIRPPAPDSIELRFNWNAAIAHDPFDGDALYFGSQFLHKSADRGESWAIISPDLTTNDPAKQKQKESGGLTLDVTHAENHTTIFTIAPSPINASVIWVGTDDGNVQVTRDGGKTWVNTVKNIANVPAASWCSHIEASKFDDGAAYVVFDDHCRGNWTTYIFKTENYGKTWLNLAKNPPRNIDPLKEPWGFAHDIEQDPVQKELLYLGTEFGLYISFDDGVNWMKWKHGLPTVPVRAVMVHPRDHDLVIGTHGRSAFIIDDVRPLRAISPAVLAKPLHLFDIPAAYQHQTRSSAGYHFPGDAIFEGQTEPFGAGITYYVNASLIKEPEKVEATPTAEAQDQPGSRRDREPKVTIQVLDSENKIIRKMEGPMKAGINRTYWGLERDGFQTPGSPGQRREGFNPPGPAVIPATYTVKIVVDKNEASQPVDVLPDPRMKVSIDGWRENHNARIRIGEKIEILSRAVDQLRSAEKSVTVILDRLKEDKGDSAKSLIKQGEALKKKLTEVMGLFVSQPGGAQGITRQDNVSRDLWAVYSSLGSSWDRPNPTQMQGMDRAEQSLSLALEKFNRVIETDVQNFRNNVVASDFTLFPTFEKLDIHWKNKESR